MLETCPNCDCVLTDSCCGEAEPYERNGKRYCCRGCAIDGECACACKRLGSAREAGDDESEVKGPVVPLL